jgi:hypothetical protein
MSAITRRRRRTTHTRIAIGKMSEDNKLCDTCQCWIRGIFHEGGFHEKSRVSPNLI